ncbi:MAG: DUF3068 domain-containing protein, partial [Chloroflexi bacterium]|nr:DUF3068 domain-containing protein [Chloroflexota bacterium]
DSFKQLLANPASLQGIAGNPAAIQTIPDPALRQVLPKLLADPTLLGLAKDPSALQLAGDPKVMALLADPASLPVVQIPVQIMRERKATKSEGGKLYLNERVATTVVGSGDPMPGFPETTAALVIDDRTSRYLEGTDGGRTGYLGFPFGVQADKTYDIYVSAARGPLPARFVKEEEFQGLDVMVFAIKETDRPMGEHPELKLPLVLDSSITLRVEPRSGRVVDLEDHATTIGVVHPVKGKLPVFVSDIELTDASVAAQVAEGKEDVATLKRLGGYLPWGAFGLGIGLAAFGGLGLRGKRKLDL